MQETPVSTEGSLQGKLHVHFTVHLRPKIKTVGGRKQEPKTLDPGFVGSRRMYSHYS